jgi:diguanylate cyclase (GGDEF)-like protein
VAVVLRSALRNADLIARYGGDEFVCILPNTDEEGAKCAAERIRKSVSASARKISESQDFALTISLGCATCSRENQVGNAAKLLKEADRCMYVAKRGGRNRIVCSSEALVGAKAQTA